MNAHPSPQTTPEQEAIAIGRRIGILLAAADMTTEVKEGILAMLPAMNATQIDRLMHALEQYMPAPHDAVLLTEAQEQHKSAQEDPLVSAAKKRALKKLDVIAQKIQTASLAS